MIIRNFVGKPLDLPTRYGKGSWAIVTGATGGTGEQYCIQLAKLGFNVILFGRSKGKLEESEKKVKEANKSVKTKVFCADLSAKFYQDLTSPLLDLHISILVNNAGWTEMSLIEHNPMQNELNNYRVMCASPTMLSRFLINKFLNRKERSAIINVSSVTQNAI